MSIYNTHTWGLPLNTQNKMTYMHDKKGVVLLNNDEKKACFFVNFHFLKAQKHEIGGCFDL